VPWRSNGLVLPAPVGARWAATHAALPTPETAAGSRVSILFAARDEHGRAAIGRAHLDLERRVADVEQERVLERGRLGTFDDSGVTTSCVVEDGGRRLLYYTGWSLGRTVPFYLCAGCAVSEDGGATYRRVSEAPILERNAVDPLLTASPWVLREGETWRMWYVSATRWEPGDGEPRHWYHIRYAESENGIDWRRDGTVCVDFAGESEHAFSRPCVVRDGERYRMWFAVRGDTYRLGYAESADGVSWVRDDAQASLDGVRDWDTEMQTYPVVFEYGGTLHMLYNGNDYGRTGIGHAVPATSR